MTRTQIELVAWGFGLVEGPVVDADGGLYFSDVTKGGVYRMAPGGAGNIGGNIGGNGGDNLETVVPKRRGVGGIALHADGGVVVSGRTVQHVRDGVVRELLAVEGVPGWNDLCAGPSGRVYVGSLRFASLRGEAAVPGECWVVAGAGADDASVLYDGVLHANGIAVAADERTVFHADTFNHAILVHTIGDDGKAERTGVIDTSGVGEPDGIALDESGCVWVAVVHAGVVARFTPDGRLDSTIEVPAAFVTSVCFDGRDLLITSGDNLDDADRGGSIFRTTVSVAGAPVPLARV
jgi:gluconolactonase